MATLSNVLDTVPATGLVIETARCTLTMLRDRLRLP